MTHQEARKKAKALVAQMTVEEKISQLLYAAPAIERLGIKEHNWWNEAAHGVARSGTATVFPHTIALAATFNPALISTVADVISTEGRVKYNKHVAHDDFDIFKGLTYWAPNINIFRDPRWGRGQETFGEDPYLSATLGSAFIKGIQGEGEFLKASACSKHFAVHSGPEKQRHEFDAIATMKDMHETYLPAFRETVKAGVTGVMGAYNRTNGAPCCAHEYLLRDVLRNTWGFDGYVVSDCGAIKDIYKHHHYTDTPAEAAAVALKAGCDLNCGTVYESLVDAYEQDLVTEEDITAAAEHLFTIRYRLGEFENPRPYADLPYSLLDCKAHQELNEKAAEDCIVLLKNDNHFLPISAKTEQKIAVIGPNVLSHRAMLGNYNGLPSEYITAADGVRRVFTEAQVRVEQGCKLVKERRNYGGGFQNMISDGVALAEESDITVLVLGLDCTVEGEETGVDDAYSTSGDKNHLYLPDTQRKLAEGVCDVCENVVVVLMCGSSVDVGEKVRNHAKAILHAWYPGARGGLALARILAGEATPGGKLPVTLYYGDHALPDFTDYTMKGRTYRFIEGEALYPFGYGLSYTTFSYSNAACTENADKTVTVTATVTNTGDRTATEKAQVYVTLKDSQNETPHYQLCSLQALELTPGESKTVTFTVDACWLKAFNENGEMVDPDGGITLFVGGHQPDAVSTRLTGTTCERMELK